MCILYLGGPVATLLRLGKGPVNLSRSTSVAQATINYIYIILQIGSSWVQIPNSYDILVKNKQKPDFQSNFIGQLLKLEAW